MYSVAGEGIAQRIAASQPALLRLAVLQTLPLQSAIQRLEVIEIGVRRIVTGAASPERSLNISLCYLLTPRVF
jgi:hypothetical protein